MVVIGFRSCSIATWKTRKDGTVLKPSTMTWKWRLILIGCLAIITACAGYYGFISAIDWASASMIIAFNVLMIWKKVEGWMVFLVATTIATILFFLSGSYLWMLNGIFSFGIGLTAVRTWLKDAKKSDIQVQSVDN
jgi:nicotinamide riboside transporter PnuC